MRSIQSRRLRYWGYSSWNRARNMMMIKLRTSLQKLTSYTKNNSISLSLTPLTKISSAKSSTTNSISSPLLIISSDLFFFTQLYILMKNYIKSFINLVCCMYFIEVYLLKTSKCSIDRKFWWLRM